MLVPVWSLSGINPSTRGISAGHVPSGAVVGLNAFGQPRYSLCPTKGTAISYVAIVMPLPKAIPVVQGFDAESLINRAITEAEVEGRAAFTYTRP
jgi:hypothetical protein